jgi:hypothetical protein
MATISFAITACNEHVELQRLLQQLKPRPSDEVIIQMDTATVTDEVKKVAQVYGKPLNATRVFVPLDGDFAKFKNKLKDTCTKDYIFFIDADEYLSEVLLSTLSDILDEPANQVDMLMVPRVNTVEGLTEDHIKMWGWSVSDAGRVNWPDFQTRIVKNIPEIKWEGKVHERVVGFNTMAALPINTEDYALIHPKDIKRQERQNNYYNTL